MNIIYAGPFETNGVYKGGISVVVNAVINEFNKGIYGSDKLIPFNTCRIDRDPRKQGKLSLGNVINTLKIKDDLSREIDKAKADIVYYNSSTGLPLLKDLIILDIIKRKCKVKVIVHIHFAEYAKIVTGNKYIQRLMTSLLKRMDGLVFLSKQTEKEFIDKGIDKENVITIYNFHDYKVDQNEIDEKIERYKHKDTLDLIFLGSINQRKGIFDLLEAVKSIKNNYVLHVCGTTTDDTSEQKYRTMTGDLTDGRINTHGYVSGTEKRRILLDSDILVLPSYAEGFPLVLLEAAATGCAIITTKVGAIPEVFSSANGEIIPPGELSVLRKAILDLCSADLSTVMEENYFLSKNYSLEQFVERTIKFINRIKEKA